MTSSTKRLSPLILGMLMICIPWAGAAQDAQPPEFVLDHWIAQQSGPEIHLTSIPLEQSFSGDADLALQETGPVAGFGISGTVAIDNEATGLVRVVLVADDGREYLVLEAYSLALGASRVSFRNACEETCVLTSVIPRRLRVEVVDATLETTSIAFNGAGPSRPSTRSAAPSAMDQAMTGDDAVRSQQVAARVRKLNESIAVRGLRWVAGDTPIARLTYAEKKVLFGGDTVPNLQGFEYYVGGIFDIRGVAAPADAAFGQSAYVDEFDWRNRHGANEPASPYFDGDPTGSGWMTSVKYQQCGDCWAHCAVGAVEAQANLFFNRHVDLDLSEQEMVSCDGGGCSGGNPWSALTYIRDNGIVEETCFPSSGTDESCANRCSNPSELIMISGFHGYSRDSEDTIKSDLITYGPTTFGIDSWWHCLVAVGYRKDPLDGGTIWILKNSWGAGWGEYGYGYVRVPLNDIYLKEAVESPVLSINVPRDIACNDLDGDGYFNWGISAERPDTCPPHASVRRDCDDSDPALYLSGQDGSCVPYAGGTTELVSVASDGTQGNSFSWRASISADGRYVSFGSGATNLVPGDTNDQMDVFVHDRLDRATERVSVASDGTEGNNQSWIASISADGRYVSFASMATNLVPGETSNVRDIFVHDRLNGTTERVSVASEGGAADKSSRGSAISADGRHVAFDSSATNLVPGDTNGGSDVFVHDRLNGTTERVSVASDGTEANDGSGDPSISADGRYVSFYSYATNLVPGDTTRYWDIFVHDRLNGTTERVSVAKDGAEANAETYGSSISADGRYVSFHSYATNLVPGDTNGEADIFVHDRLNGTTERASVAGDGTEGNAGSCCASISADGRHVGFVSEASNLVPGETNSPEGVFVHDRLNGFTERVSVASDGTEGIGSHVYGPSVSADGRHVAFDFNASNLVPGGTNGRPHIFVRDRAPMLSDTVTIDVRPGDAINAVNPQFGMIPVAILSTSTSAGEEVDFDAVQVDPATTTLGPHGATVGISSRNVQAIDVDGDGDVDLKLRFRARDTGIECSDTRITLHGETYEGEPFTGEDSIRPVLCQ